MGSTDAIDVAHLAKVFREVTALEDLTLRVPRGEIFGFLGPNGAGKTTAVKLLLGLMRPSAGDGRVLGRPLGDRAACRAIGYLPELFRYHGWMSAREELAFHARLIGLALRESRAQISEVLQLVGLASRADDTIATYSKGMAQRLGLGVALLGRPELVFLDEPTSALDPVGRRDVRDLLRELRARGTAVFLNSHLLGEVEQVCDRVAVVDRGRIVAGGPLAEVIGARGGVRLRVSEDGVSLPAVLGRFGALRRDGEWLVVEGAAREQVPEIVRAAVSAGARLYAVEPLTATLEERFLEILRLHRGARETER